eukprot:6134079-Pyramimonas_sp.AAC.1
MGSARQEIRRHLVGPQAREMVPRHYLRLGTPNRESEPHRRPQWGSHGGLGRFRHTPHEDRGPIGSSTEGP